MLEKCCGTRKAHDRAVYARIFIAIDSRYFGMKTSWYLQSHVGWF